jgi:dephospho-CoA kinase
MLRVGLTGNIASGKSSVVSIWEGMGAHVIDADVLARQAVAPGSPGLAAVAAAFGPEALTATGDLDRAAMRRIVFADPDARRRLEAIIHPEVARLRELEERLLEARGARIVVHDIPLLFEVGADRDMDLVVLVDAPEEVRLQRLVRDRGLPEAEARAMIAAQQPAVGKRRRAHIIIDNDGTPAQLATRAAEAWERIRARAEGQGASGSEDASG